MNKTKPAQDHQLQEITLKAAAVDLALKEADLKQKEWNFRHPYGAFSSAFRNPLLIGAFITALATAGASLVSFLNARYLTYLEIEKAELQMQIERSRHNFQKIIEEAKYESGLIVKAMELGNGDLDILAKNIEFLLESRLIYTTDRRQGLTCYIIKRKNLPVKDPDVLKIACPDLQP